MMIKCPECGKEISSKATSCPHCGCPIKEAEAKVVEAEVVPPSEAKKPEASKEEKLIEQYENDIEIDRHRRKVMIGWGIALNVICIIGIVVFTVLLAMGLAKDIPQASTDEEIIARIAGLSALYYSLIIVFALGLAAAEALIIVGAVPNSIKITKRQNKIHQLRK